MLALGWSSGKDLLLVAMLGVTTLVAPRPARHACSRAAGPAPIHAVRVSLLAPHASRSAAHDLIRIACDAADRQYQHREFARAAQTLRLAVRHDPSLEASAELYDQLQRAWDRASAPEASVVTQFEAWRYARRLDLSLGGRWADLLDARLREVAPRAATFYRDAQDHEGEELALASCDALGVRPSTVRDPRR